MDSGSRIFRFQPVLRRGQRSGVRCFVVCFLLTSLTLIGLANGQEQQRNAEGEAKLSRAELKEELSELGNASYRRRQLARSRLNDAPLIAIELIEQAARTADANRASQLIELLSGMAIHRDLQVNVQAREALERLASPVSLVGRQAENTLLAISDIQEQRAIAALRFHGAYVDRKDWGSNGGVAYPTGLFGLRIDESFDGDEQVIESIQFLKSIEAVYLRGKAVDVRYLKAISKLPKLKDLKLRDVSIEAEDLKFLEDSLQLEHLGLNYIPLDDKAIDVLFNIPMNRSLRLFGTRITKAGEERLRAQLDDLQIYRGNGGFLGVAMAVSNVVTQVEPGSAASRAGIYMRDRIVQIGDTRIENFEELREELGKCFVGDEIKIRVQRSDGESLTELELKAELAASGD